MQYDGSDLMAEYNAANVLLSRYVHGPGTDEPILWYEGSTLTDKRYLLSDERGSVTSITNATGTVTNISSYDEYGIPAVTNTGRFGYAGQTWLPEIGMNYCKARMYSPTLGRFMQPDPIGYGDGMNLYAYVGGDPVNFVDPSGLFGYSYNCPQADVVCDDDDGPLIATVTGRRLSYCEKEANFARFYCTGGYIPLQGTGRPEPQECNNLYGQYICNRRTTPEEACKRANSVLPLIEDLSLSGALFGGGVAATTGREATSGIMKRLGKSGVRASGFAVLFIEGLKATLKSDQKQCK